MKKIKVICKTKRQNESKKRKENKRVLTRKRK